MATIQRSRYLQYLPAIFEEIEPGKPRTLDLGQFLLPFEGVFAEFDALLAAIDRHFAPELAPADEFLPWLASWVALTLDEEWKEDQRRRLISEAVELYRWRGTIQGLKRYLVLYTGWEESAFEFQEARWPGGMQIGVASRIGGVIATPRAAPPTGAAALQSIQQDYYVVDTLAPTALPDDRQLPVADGQPLQLYYSAGSAPAAGSVERIQIEETGVHITYRKPNNGGVVTLFHKRPNGAGPTAPPNITRRAELTDYAYTQIAGSTTDPTNVVNYRGGSFLIEQIEAPYRFIVHIYEPASTTTETEEQKQKRRAKVRRILELEKPAHTDYYLKITPAVEKTRLLFMQIGVRSSIGLNTTVA